MSDSGVHVEPIRIIAGRRPTARSSAPRNGARPVIRMLDWQNALPEACPFTARRGGWFALDGIVVVGRGVQL